MGKYGKIKYFFVKNINSYIFLIFFIIIFEIFGFFENFLNFIGLFLNFGKKKEKPADPSRSRFPPHPWTRPADPFDPTGLGRITAKPLKMNPLLPVP
jgi:hypothetical protein